MPSVPLPNFSKGEIAPDLYGRIDTAQYNAGLKTCRNFLVQKYGGVTFRPGTRVVGTIDDPDEPTRLIPFQFSHEQSYVQVHGHGHFRLAAGNETSAGFVIEQDTDIVAITLGNPTILEITDHGYEVGDRIFLTGIDGTTELNGRVVTVTDAPDADHVEVDIDSTGMGAFTGSTGVTNPGPPPAPPAPPLVPPPIPSFIPPEFGGYGGYDYWWGNLWPERQF